jgi:hypothetical protein
MSPRNGSDWWTKEEDMLELRYEFLCDLEAEVEPAIPIGATPHGLRMIYGIKGGTVKGPSLTGVVLHSGADWLVLRPDGAIEVDVRLAMQTHDGEFIYACYRGIISLPPGVYDRIQSGDKVDPVEYYFRTTPVFETGSKKYDWLNGIIAVGVGQLFANRVIYKLYRIL